MTNCHATCDSHRIDLFLQQKLSDDEQAAFESHLTECDDCCRRLEATAASEDAWRHARDCLRGDCPDFGHRAERGRSKNGTVPFDATNPRADESVTGEEAFSSQATILKLLAPTDDDRMIGRWGTYEVVGVVGTGGMGVVLKAFDAALNRYVAIKILAPHLGTSGAAIKRFSREGKAAAAVVHDNVIEIHGVAEAAGLPYLVMPYVRGPSLQRRLDDEGPLAVVEILRVAMQAAAGLAAAHAQGLVHRDVKPANILLADGIERVKLTDFGLARAADDASLTRTGVIAGTPQYMSPEQARGEPVDPRSDLFSLGSVLYAMCTGRPPFRAETSYGVLRRITDEEPRPIREINPDIPDWLCGIVGKLMAKRPEDRFQSAHEVAAFLEQCLAHVQQPTAVPLPKAVVADTSPTRKRVGDGSRKRHKGLLARASGLYKLPLLKGTLDMLTLLGISLFAAGVVSTSPPDISGNWQGDDWGQVTLTQTAPGEYTGTYTDTVVKEKGSGKIALKWSRIERRFNGTWREGEDDRFGDLSVRRVDNEIRGALTTDAKSKINPATPRLADLIWTRAEPVAAEAGSPTIWDVAKDFSTTLGNPHGAWTYGMVKDSKFVPYTLRKDAPEKRFEQAELGGEGLRPDELFAPLWYGTLPKGDSKPPLPNGTPLAGLWCGPAGIARLQPGQFYLHPGPQREASVARWTAPQGLGPYARVQGRFLPGDIGVMQVGIFLNGVPQVAKPYWHASDSGRFDIVLPIAAGDTIDFAVYGGYMYGTTPLEATITTGSAVDFSSFRPEVARTRRNENEADEPPGTASESSHAHALQFDGNSGSYVDAAHPTALPTGMSARTLGAWFKLASVGEDRGPDTSGYGPDPRRAGIPRGIYENVKEIIGYGPNAKGRRFAIILDGDRIGAEQCGSDATGRWRPDTNWHHVAAVVPEQCSRTNQILVYLDGKRLATTNHIVISTEPTWTERIVPADGSEHFDTLSEPLKIGGIPTVDYAYSFNGLLSEVRIYDRALSAAEIAVLHGDRQRATNRGLVAGYHFDEGRGTTVADFSGHGNDGTLHGGVTWAGSTVQVIPPRLPPGSRYQLLLITGGSIQATSSDIKVYNDFAAAQITNPALTSLGVSWKALVSTPSVSARKNSPTSTLPIYNTRGQLIALNSSDLWDSTISAFILDQYGQSDPRLAWTGTSPSGESHFGPWSLGQGGGYGNVGPHVAVVGGGGGDGGRCKLDWNWIAQGLLPWTEGHPIFALSSPITVVAPDKEMAPKENASGTVPPHSRAIQFDGNHYAKVDPSPKFTSGDFTISLWCNPVRSNHFAFPFMRGYSYRDQQGDIALKLNRDSGELDFQARTDIEGWLFGWDAPESRLRGAVRYGQWNHVVVTRRGDNYTIWMNGKRAGSEKSAASISDADNTNPFIVGGIMEDNGVVDRFRGALDDFRIFHRCLSNKEIDALYKSGGHETFVHGEYRVKLGPLVAGGAKEKTAGIESVPSAAPALELASQRIGTLEALVGTLEKDLDAGNARLSDFYEAQEKLLNAQLEAAKSKAERAAIWEKLLKVRQGLEKKAEASVKEKGTGPDEGAKADLLRARAERQKAELGLAEEKAQSGVSLKEKSPAAIGILP